MRFLPKFSSAPTALPPAEVIPMTQMNTKEAMPQEYSRENMAVDTNQVTVSSRRSTEDGNNTDQALGPLEDIPLNEPRTSLPEREDLSSLGKARKWALFACSCLLQFLLQLDMASVAVTLPNIAKDLNSSQTLVFCVATGYFLAQTVFQLAFSHMSHGMGRKYAYLSGVALYIIGAIIAATSKCTRQLVAARAMQGTGAAGMFTMSAIVVVEIMPPRKRAAYTAISQASGALGNICGPLFAALLFKKFTWRSIFILESAFATHLFLALFLLLPNWRSRKTKLTSVLRHCDWVGMLLFMVSSVAILIPINIGGTVQPWRSWAVISCLLVGVVSLVGLIYHQRRVATNPAFPREIFSKTVTNAAFLGSLVSGMLLSMVFYMLVLFWEGVRQQSTLRIGIMLLSVTLTYAFSAAIVGLSIRSCGRIQWATITGTVCAVLGLGLMWFMDDECPEWALILISVVAAAGCGIFLPAMINTVLATTEKAWHSHAIAQRTLLYTAGQCMGISMGLAIFTNKFASEISKLPNSEGSSIITPQSLMRVIKDLPPHSETIKLMVDALRWVWGAAAGMALVTGVLPCTFKCPRLPKDEKPVSGPAAAVECGEDEERQERQAVAARSRHRFSMGWSKKKRLPSPTPRTPSRAPASTALDSDPAQDKRASSRFSSAPTVVVDLALDQDLPTGSAPH